MSLELKIALLCGALFTIGVFVGKEIYKPNSEISQVLKVHESDKLIVLDKKIAVLEAQMFFLLKERSEKEDK